MALFVICPSMIVTDHEPGDCYFSPYKIDGKLVQQLEETAPGACFPSGEESFYRCHDWVRFFTSYWDLLDVDKLYKIALSAAMHKLWDIEYVPLRDFVDACCSIETSSLLAWIMKHVDLVMGGLDVAGDFW